MLEGLDPAAFSSGEAFNEGLPTIPESGGADEDGASEDERSGLRWRLAVSGQGERDRKAAIRPEPEPRESRHAIDAMINIEAEREELGLGIHLPRRRRPLREGEDRPAHESAGRGGHRVIAPSRLHSKEGLLVLDDLESRGDRTEAEVVELEGASGSAEPVVRVNLRVIDLDEDRPRGRARRPQIDEGEAEAYGEESGRVSAFAIKGEELLLPPPPPFSEVMQDARRTPLLSTKRWTSS